MKAKYAFNCEEASARLEDYLDHELSLEQVGGMLWHLEECATCAARCERAYQQLARTRAAVQSFDMPDTFQSRLHAMLQAKTSKTAL